MPEIDAHLLPFPQTFHSPTHAYRITFPIDAPGIYILEGEIWEPGAKPAEDIEVRFDPISGSVFSMRLVKKSSAEDAGQVHLWLPASRAQ